MDIVRGALQSVVGVWSRLPLRSEFTRAPTTEWVRLGHKIPSPCLATSLTNFLPDWGFVCPHDKWCWHLLHLLSNLLNYAIIIKLVHIVHNNNNTSGNNCLYDDLYLFVIMCRHFSWALPKHLATGCTGYQPSTSRLSRTLCWATGSFSDTSLPIRFPHPVAIATISCCIWCSISFGRCRWRRC